MGRAILHPPAKPPETCVLAPGSKSITNRALVMAALAEGCARLDGILIADDSLRMLEALEALGFDVQAEEQQLSVRVCGAGGAIPAASAAVYVHQAGTVMRFLTAVLCLGAGPYRLDGDARMRERPIGPLVDALRRLGARIEYAGNDGYPPLTIRGRASAGETSVKASVSSQFISGLLLEASGHDEKTRIRLEGRITSRPFIDATVRLLADFGGHAAWVAADTLEASGPLTAPARYVVEADATAACYFWAAAALTSGRVTVGNLSSRSLQGDVRFVRVLEAMGCRASESEHGITVEGGGLRGGRFDMNDMPDVVQTLAAVAMFADGVTRIENVANLRFKETDRLAALAAELARVGGRVRTGDDWLEVTPAASYRPAALKTYGDHRMAMSMALLGLRIPGIEIEEPECVAKTFPEYFLALRDSLGAGVELRD